MLVGKGEEWMNNGKVRIYDLSKELNLDNKELLAICDQLDIAVKSHSSTITEGEAERIRAAAEKVATMPASNKESTANNHKSQQVTTKAKPRPPIVPNKQQILEIRKPKNLDRSNPNLPEQTAVAPQAPVRLSATTPPARTAVQNQSDNPHVEVETLAPAKTDGSNGNRNNVSPPVSSPAQPERPRLTSPPSRPAETPAPAVNKASRPILKREQVVPPTNPPTETPSSAAKGEKPTRRQPTAPSSEPVVAKPKPVVELQRPKPARVNEPVSAIAPVGSIAGVAGQQLDSEEDEAVDGII